MRKSLIVGLVMGATYLSCAAVYAERIDAHAISRHTLIRLCGDKLKSAGGHTGCDTCNTKTGHCHDFDCNDATGKCQVQTFIKGNPTKRRGVTGIKVPTRPTSGLRHLHPKGRNGVRPVKIGGSAPPMHTSRHAPHVHTEIRQH